MEKMEKIYKPKIGDIVYTACPTSWGIQKDKVGYIGEKAFIVEDFSEYRLFDSLHYYYEDYNETWFTSFSDARNKLINDMKQLSDGKIKIRKINNEYWEITCE